MCICSFVQLLVTLSIVISHNFIQLLVTFYIVISHSNCDLFDTIMSDFLRVNDAGIEASYTVQVRTLAGSTVVNIPVTGLKSLYMLTFPSKHIWALTFQNFVSNLFIIRLLINFMYMYTHRHTHTHTHTHTNTHTNTH